MSDATTQGAIAEVVTSPNRCVIVLAKELPPGRAANAAAVIALTIGQRHPALVGLPLVDANGFEHPGLIPIGIAVLAAGQDEIAQVRQQGLAIGCDVVSFPVEGQQTKDYQAFMATVAEIPTADLHYVGVALIGQKKPINKIVGALSLL